MQEEQNRILDLKEEGYSWTQIANRLGYPSVDSVRGRVRKTQRYKEMMAKKKEQTPVNNNTQEDFQKKDYHDDGSIGSQIRVRQKIKKVFTNEELIELHGFDPKEVTLKSATSNEWTTPVAGETYYNYQSKIVVVPKKKELLAIDEIRKCFDDIEPRRIELACDDLPKDYLLIPLSDMHFGLNNDEDYKDLQKEIADKILNTYEEILFTIHGDYFHVDNFLNTTEKGTRIDDVDFREGIQAGYRFIVPLLELALENSPNVKVVYLKGNHAPSVDYMFVDALEKRYSQIEFDTTLDEFKHAWLGTHSIFMHHGDKVKNPTKLHGIMTTHFAKEWGESQSRYLITGHLHHEKSLSFAGVTWYQLQSPSKHSSYDKTNGFDTSETGQMLFEFSETKRSAVYYV